MKKNIKIGDIVDNKMGDMFKIFSIYSNINGEAFPVEGLSIATTTNFIVDEVCSWTKEGHYDTINSLNDYNIINTYTKEENPEYFL